MSQINSLKWNIILNFIKTFTSILFPMVTFKYASNVLSAENLGAVSFCSSIIGYFTLLAGLGISSYASREGPKMRNNKKEISSFASQVFTINLFSCLVSFVILLVAIHSLEELRMYRNILLLQSLVMIFTTLGTEWINIIYEDFLYITIRTVIMQCVSLVLMFVFVKNEDDYLIYVLITVLAQVGMYILNIFHVQKMVKFKPVIYTEWRLHLKPILTIFASTIAITIYVTIDTTMIGLFCEKEDVAYYTAATKIYSALKSIFSTILVALTPRLSYLISQSEKSYNEVIEIIVRGIVILLIPCTILSNVLCKDLILLISGSEYLVAYSSLHILSIAVVFSAFSTFIVNAVFLIRGKEQITLIATTIGAVVNFIINLFLIRKMSYYGAAISSLIAEIAVFLICYLSLKRHKIKIIHSNNIVRCLLKDVFAGMAMLVVCISLHCVIPNYLIRIIIICSVGGLVFIGMLVLQKHEILYSELKNILKKGRIIF